MDTGTLVLIGAIGVSVLGLITYLLFMIFLPEWVGITGNAALESEKSHSGGEGKESRFWTLMDQEPIKAKNNEATSSPVDETSKDSHRRES